MAYALVSSSGVGFGPSYTVTYTAVPPNVSVSIIDQSYWVIPIMGKDAEGREMIIGFEIHHMEEDEDDSDKDGDNDEEVDKVVQRTYVPGKAPKKPVG